MSDSSLNELFLVRNCLRLYLVILIVMCNKMCLFKLSKFGVVCELVVNVVVN